LYSFFFLSFPITSHFGRQGLNFLLSEKNRM
jgi:hypothetical protein